MNGSYQPAARRDADRRAAAAARSTTKRFGIGEGDHQVDHAVRARPPSSSATSVLLVHVEAVTHFGERRLHDLGRQLAAGLDHVVDAPRGRLGRRSAASGRFRLRRLAAVGQLLVDGAAIALHAHRGVAPLRR